MTVIEVRERAEVIRKTFDRSARTLAEYSLLFDVIAAVAGGAMSYGNAKTLCVEALKVTHGA